MRQLERGRVAVLAVVAEVAVGLLSLSCLATDEARPGQCLAERHDCFVVCYSLDFV
jgi:hypothetical protein